MGKQARRDRREAEEALRADRLERRWRGDRPRERVAGGSEFYYSSGGYRIGPLPTADEQHITKDYDPWRPRP